MRYTEDMNPLSEQLCNLSTSEALQRLAEKNRALVEERLSTIDVESQIAEEISKREETGGFWQSFVEEPLEEAGQEFIDTFGGDRKSVGEAKAVLESLIHSLFDPQAILANLTSAVLPPDVVSLDRYISDAAFPASLVERVPNLGGRKDPLAAEPCHRSVVQATITTAARVAVGAISNASRALKAVQTSLGFVRSSVEDLGPALMRIPVQNLLTILGSQDFIISQMISVTEEIISIVDGMDEEDYPADHINIIRREQSRLRGADSKLAAVEARLLAGASFHQPLWDSARKDIKDSADVFCGLDLDDLIGGLNLKPFKLIGLVNYLETLCAVLKRQQEQREALEAAINDFEDQFLEATVFDNLFFPIVDQIRCRLRKILEDMDATIAKNQFVRYLIKEKEWCLELMVIAQAMKFSNKLSLPDNIRKFTGTDAIEDATRDVVDFTRDLREDLQAQNVRQLILICESFTRSVRIKAVRNIPYQAIIAEGQELIRRATACRKEGSFFGGLLDGFSGTVAKTAGAAITSLALLLEFSKERNLSSFIDAIEGGRLTEAFGIDALTTTLEGQLTQLVACIVATSRQNSGGNPVAEAELLAVNAVFQDEARDLGLLDRLMHNYAESHIEDQLEGEAVVLKGTAERIKRAGDALDEPVSSTGTHFIPPKKATAQKKSALS